PEAAPTPTSSPTPTHLPTTASVDAPATTPLVAVATPAAPLVAVAPAVAAPAVADADAVNIAAPSRLPSFCGIPARSPGDGSRSRRAAPKRALLSGLKSLTVASRAHAPAGGAAPRRIARAPDGAASTPCSG